MGECGLHVDHEPHRAANASALGIQKVLLALFAAIVVASAEAVLFLIWSSRQRPSRIASRSKRAIGVPIRKVSADKAPPTTIKSDGEEEEQLTTVASADKPPSSNLQEFRTSDTLRERNKSTRHAAGGTHRS